MTQGVHEGDKGGIEDQGGNSCFPKVLTITPRTKGGHLDTVLGM